MKFDLCFIGDSLTYGWKHQGWFNWLRMKSKYKILNYNTYTGICGGTPYQMYNELLRTGIPNAKAFFVMCGANNICCGKSPIYELIHLLQFISLYSKADIYLSTITWRYQLNDLVEEANYHIRSFNDIFNKVKVVDMYPLYKNRLDVKIADKIHFNSKGYAIWYNVLKSKVFPNIKV